MGHAQDHGPLHDDRHLYGQERRCSDPLNLFVNASVGMCSESDITTNKSDIHTVFVLALIEFTQGGAFLCTKKNY